MAPLLLHLDGVPAGARAALRDALDAPAEQRARHLEEAARALHDVADLDCDDARELVGLSAGSCC
jgi:hypothetical protein